MSIVLDVFKTYLFSCPECKKQLKVEGAPGKYIISGHLSPDPKALGGYGENCRFSDKELSEAQLQEIIERN